MTPAAAGTAKRLAQWDALPAPESCSHRLPCTSQSVNGGSPSESMLFILLLALRVLLSNCLFACVHLIGCTGVPVPVLSLSFSTFPFWLCHALWRTGALPLLMALASAVEAGAGRTFSAGSFAYWP